MRGRVWRPARQPVRRPAIPGLIPIQITFLLHSNRSWDTFLLLVGNRNQEGSWQWAIRGMFGRGL